MLDRNHSGASGPMKIHIESGSLALTLGFIRELRSSRYIRLDRLTGMVVWIRANDRHVLDELLQNMQSVASVRTCGSDLEVELAHPPEQFSSNENVGTTVIESSAVAPAEVVA